MWESGGATSQDYGTATVLCDAKGMPKVALYVKDSGDLSCKEHALIPLRIGDHIIQVNRYQDTDEYGKPQNFVDVRAYQIMAIKGTVAECNAVYISEPDIKAVPKHLRPAVRAAKAKSRCYHCRETHYANMPVRKEAVNG
jgi:hypothetical protein